MIFMNSLIILSHFNGDCMTDDFVLVLGWKEHDRRKLSGWPFNWQWLREGARKSGAWLRVGKQDTKIKGWERCSFCWAWSSSKKTHKTHQTEEFWKKEEFPDLLFLWVVFPFPRWCTTSKIMQKAFLKQCLAVASYAVKLYNVRLKSSLWSKSLLISVFL